MGARQGKIAGAAGVLLVVGLVVAYFATLPQPRPYHRPVIRVAATDPDADLAAQSQAEQSYNGDEKRAAAAQKQARATDTPVIDVCTGKPIGSGPMVEIHNKKLECPPPRATKGAHDAVYALEHECAATKRTPGATTRAAAYLLHEAHARRTQEIFDLLLEAFYIELDCDRTSHDLDLAIKFLNAAELVNDSLRPYNRFLDPKHGSQKQDRRDHRVARAKSRAS